MRRILLTWLSALVCSLALQAESVVYYPVSRTAVEADGDRLSGSSASYSKKTVSSGERSGQLTAENILNLSISDAGDITIHAIALSLHTNKSSGIGGGELYIGDKLQMAFTTDDLFDGEDFSSTPYTFILPLDYPLQLQNQTIELYLEAQTNSLYFDSLRINYALPKPKTYTVSFATHVPQTVAPVSETVVGGGIVLPDFSYNDATYRFVGWMVTPIEQTTAIPFFLSYGSTYFPAKDITLHALYKDGEELSTAIEQDTLFENGTYIIADSLWKCMAKGRVDKDNNYRVATDKVSLTYNAESGLFSIPRSYVIDDNTYNIEFNTDDSTLTIYHPNSKSYIGFPSTDKNTLANAKSDWNYAVNDRHQLKIYHNYNYTKHREFHADSGTSIADINIITYQNTSFNAKTDNILFRVDNLPLPVAINYTSFPLGTAVETITTPLLIQNNTLQNPLQQCLTVYNMTGQSIITTQTDLPLSLLPKGVFIIRIGSQTGKLTIK